MRKRLKRRELGPQPNKEEKTSASLGTTPRVQKGHSIRLAQPSLRPGLCILPAKVAKSVPAFDFRPHPYCNTQARRGDEKVDSRFGRSSISTRRASKLGLKSSLIERVHQDWLLVLHLKFPTIFSNISFSVLFRAFGEKGRSRRRATVLPVSTRRAVHSCAAQGIAACWLLLGLPVHSLSLRTALTSCPSLVFGWMCSMHAVLVAVLQSPCSPSLFPSVSSSPRILARPPPPPSSDVHADSRRSLCGVQGGPCRSAPRARVFGLQPVPGGPPAAHTRGDVHGQVRRAL